jgi:peptide-methionine (S)-S-oxide reductase
MSQTIVLAGGCFWCLEAIFQRVNGIINVKSGYTGGTIPNPTYRTVCEGCTCHAEVIKVNFDPTIITLERILQIFWSAHDPTTLNKQGQDVGTQYRSAIFYHDLNQKEIIEKSIQNVAILKWGNKITTEISPLTEFYPADASHDNFYNLNKNHPYCQLVINPKLKKLKELLEYVSLF